MDSPVVVKLKHPLTIAGATVGVIHLRRPRVRDLERLDRQKGDMARIMALIVDLAEMDPEVVRELDAEDFNAIATAITGFFGEASPP